MATGGISYELRDGEIRVRLGRGIVGVIRKTHGGYHYRSNSGAIGDTFDTVAEVKASLDD